MSSELVWTTALNLPGFEVVAATVEQAQRVIRLTVVPGHPVAVCPHCGDVCRDVHQTRDLEAVRDLPLADRAVELVVRVAQWWCATCRRAFTPPIPGLAEGTPATERFLTRAADLIRHGDVTRAAEFLRVPEKTLERWYYDGVERQQQQRPAVPITRIGIDELSLKKSTEKKHRQFVCVIVDHTNRRVLEVLESREKGVVVKFLQDSQATGLLAQVTEVTSDMWDGDVTAAREVFGASAVVTIDRFHVMQNLQEQLTAARREIQRDLPREEARELKGSRWLWLTNPENLEDAQRQRLTTLKSQFPRLAQLADQREALRQLFEDRSLTTAAAGFARLTQWLSAARALGLSALNQFCDTLERWQDKIANYFVSRSSNGPTEGFNNGLRTILRRSFGMLNFRHFRLRVLDLFGRPRPQEST